MGLFLEVCRLKLLKFPWPSGKVFNPQYALVLMRIMSPAESCDDHVYIYTMPSTPAGAPSFSTLCSNFTKITALSYLEHLTVMLSLLHLYSICLMVDQ